MHSFLTQSIGKTNKIIYFSTGSVYKSSKEYLSEESEINHFSGNPYISSKIMAEELIYSFKSYFTEIIIVRPFFIYGHGQKENMLISTMIHNVKNNIPITLNNNVGLIFNPIHVEDVNRFIELHLETSLNGISTYNIFGPETITLFQVVKEIELVLEKRAIIITNDNPATKLVASSKDLRFKPFIGISTGINKMIKTNYSSCAE